jgi:hypothetical protein
LAALAAAKLLSLREPPVAGVVVVTPRPPLMLRERPLGDPDLMEVQIPSRLEDERDSYVLVRKSDWKNKPTTAKSGGRP